MLICYRSNSGLSDPELTGKALYKILVLCDFATYSVNINYKLVNANNLACPGLAVLKY